MLTPEQKNAVIAKTVFEWLKNEKAIRFANCFLLPTSESYDEKKAFAQIMKTKLLTSLEQTILEAIPDLHQTRESTSGEKCNMCHTAPALEPHACPFKVDVDDNHDPNYCNCCKECQSDCANEI